MPEYITLAEAKAQCSIDSDMAVHNERLALLIGAAIDWAQNFTQRSLGELSVLDTPPDGATVPVPEPVYLRSSMVGVNLDFTSWTDEQWAAYATNNPTPGSNAKPLRRDVKAGVLLYMESLFTRDPADMALLTQRAQDMLQPYRMGLGV